MILIRGIKGEMYARKIENGIVDCRDILSAILKPPETGYAFSDYYEKNLVKALTFFTEYNDLHDPNFLYSLLTDYYIPHIYLSYFHILNENSVSWLDNFDDDYSFIAINVKLDKITKTVIGSEFFGSKMSYVDDIRNIDQNKNLNAHIACMCSIENLFDDKRYINEPVQIYNTLFFPLLCREQDEKYTDIENEFRIIAYDCPKFENCIRKQIDRKANIIGGTRSIYTGVLKAGRNTIFKSNLSLLMNPYKTLHDILFEEHGQITLNSSFKSIDIRDIASDYRYIGNKQNCINYIKKTLSNPPKNEYVNRTVKRTYSKEDLDNVYFTPGHQNVKY